MLGGVILLCAFGQKFLHPLGCICCSVCPAQSMGSQLHPNGQIGMHAVFFTSQHDTLFQNAGESVAYQEQLQLAGTPCDALQAPAEVVCGTERLP